MNTRVSFYTLGCRLNQAETAILQRNFEAQGFRVVDFREPADVVVVNTCTVTENGDTDTRKLVNKIRRMNPRARVALVGCQAQIQREALLQLPGVHWVVGNARKMDLPQLLQDALPEEKPLVEVPAIPRKPFTIPGSGIDRQHTRANLKIQDGCDFFCSYCIIPYARGRARSREFEDILREARELAQAGHRELVLTGINIGTYRYQDKTLQDVITALEQIEGVARIRISSIEPTTFTPELYQRTWPRGKLCRYLHLPLQSGSNTILQRMNRHYTREEFLDFVKRIRQQVPGIGLGTDVIVGFPGETKELFAETYTFLQELPVAYFHVFSYSERKLARSRHLSGKVERPVIEQRSKLLRELSARKRRLYLEQHLGQEEMVLFEQQKKGDWTGLTDTYIRVKVKTEKNLSNQMLPVRLVAIEGQAMRGELI